MNLELWNKGVDWIEAHPDEYDQSSPGIEFASRKCSSPCCFFGTIAMLTGLWSLGGPDLMYRVGWILEIRPKRAAALYEPAWPGRWFEKAGMESGRGIYGKTPNAQEAVAILRGMAKDGEVWSVP